jgi:tRNA(Met) C34 N-acetyltransferase TmcA
MFSPTIENASSGVHSAIQIQSMSKENEKIKDYHTSNLAWKMDTIRSRI